MMDFTGEVLEETKQKTEENKVTQRFNKYDYLKDWRN